MIMSRQLEQSRSRNVVGEKTAALHVDERIPRAVDDQGWHVDRGQNIADIDLGEHLRAAWGRARFLACAASGSGRLFGSSEPGQ